MPPKRRHSSPEPETTVVAPRRDFWDTFKNYYDSSTDSDITLYLGVDRAPFPGHRFILRARCFHARLKEFKWDGKYVLYFDDHPVGILKLMLQYIYTGDYNIDLGTRDAQAEFGSIVDPLKIHSMVSCAGSTYEYDVEGLQDICLAKLKDCILTNWNVQSFFHGIRVVFNDPEFDHPELCPVVIEAALEHAQELRQNSEFLALMDTIPEFTKALAKKMLSKRVLAGGPSTKDCSNNGWAATSEDCSWDSGSQSCVKDEPVTSAGVSCKRCTYSDISASTGMQTSQWNDDPFEETPTHVGDCWTADDFKVPKAEASTAMPGRVNVESQESWDAPEGEDFQDGFKYLWDDKTTSDVILCSNDGHTLVHAHWLFINMRTNAFVDFESDKYKTYKGVKDLVNTSLDEQTLYRVVQYIYEGDYDAHASEYYEEDIFEIHALVYKAAQEYQIRGLTKVCVDKFRDLCTKRWNCDSFCKAAEIIYSVVVNEGSTKDIMKEGVLQEAIVRGAELCNRPRFQAILQDKDKAIAGDLVLKVLSKNSDSWAEEGCGCSW
ncbi:predicted protein [Paecilomyces variotii No. 5]|uniref:BTB domain-containing protein n=1 Tax=Byssochlamys spectabilis (strain No. 5 / NBRC 109023) TaxID=1356009 RepID=V5G5B4_BYSSN|nr:predicted protein [Paecilomyces variotii No. 5]